MKVLFVFLLSSQVQSDTLFKADIDNQGHPQCSLDPPSANVSLTQPSSSIPLCFLCGWECKETPNCTGFNLKCNNRTCELYFYQPTTFKNIPECLHYSVCTSDMFNDDIEFLQNCQRANTYTHEQIISRIHV